MSNSREHILAAIRDNKPPARDLPMIPLFKQVDSDNDSVFEQMIQTSGGKLIRLASGEKPLTVLHVLFPEAKKIISTTDAVKSTVVWENDANPSMLDGIDLAILEGELGVAENGAVWISEANMGHRVLPFITQHLVVMLPKENLLDSMTEAYQKISIDKDGFGLFIAGPSKTADIEQSLVIGAQGARSFTVILR